MKPMVITIVAFVTAFVIGMGSMRLIDRPAHTERSQNARPPSAYSEPVDRRAQLEALTVGQTSNVQAPVDVLLSPPTPNATSADSTRLEAIGIKQKLLKRQGNYEYVAWQVEVRNNTTNTLKAYIEIEWLDEDGFRIDYSNEVRTCEPGTHSISKVHMLELAEADKVKLIRIVKVEER